MYSRQKSAVFLCETGMYKSMKTGCFKNTRWAYDKTQRKFTENR